MLVCYDIENIFDLGLKAKRGNKYFEEYKNRTLNKIKEARDKFIQATKKLKWNIKYSAKSSIKGKSGNHEELFLFEK